VVTAYPVLGKQKSVDICDAFIAGAPRDAEGYVFYGVNRTNIEAWNRARKERIPFWYVDNSYFDVVRGKQFRITRNAVQVDLSTRQISDGKRFDALGVKIKPWRDLYAGKYVLACEQSLTFMQDIAREPKWVEHVLREFFEDWPIKLRRWDADKLKQQATLVEDLKEARVLVVHTSSAAVTALLEGVSVVVSDMSAVKGVKYNDNRLPVMCALADNQFSIKEMKGGIAWSLLNRQ